jgi:hypothetical protein
MGGRKMGTLKSKEDVKALMEHAYSILLELVGSDLSSKVYFAGGCIRDSFHGVTPKDFDVYCIDQATQGEVRSRLAKKHILSNSVHNFDIWFKNYKFNIITNSEFFGLPSDIIKQFNFTVNQNWYNGNHLEAANLRDIRDKHLIVCEACKYPLGVMVKLLRMLELGYKIDEKQFMALLGKVLPLNIQSKEEFVKHCPALSTYMIGFATGLPSAKEYFNKTSLGKELL